MNGQMRDKWRIGLSTALVALVWSGAAGAETLGNALVSAYKNSNLLEQNRAVLRAADEDVALTATTLRPVISWMLQSQYTDTRLGNDTVTSGLLNMDWEIYDFGRTALDREAAKETVLATRQALISVEQDVFLSAVTAYMDVHRARQDVANNRTSVNVLSEQLRAAEDRFSVGEVTRTDVALAEARLAAVRASLAAAEGDLDVAHAAYLTAVGHASDGKTQLPPTPALPKTLQEAQNIAVKLHPAILQASHQVRAADLNYARAGADRRPKLGLNLQAEHDDDGENDGAATIQLSQPLFTGGKLAAGERKAMASRDRARSALSQTAFAVREQVTNAWSLIKVSRAQIGAIDQQIVAARSAYEGVQEEAKVGARTTLDVLDAERDLLDAQSSRTAAEANLQIANYSLLAAMGLLTVENLKLGIPTYDPEAYYDAVKDAPILSPQGSKLDRVLKAIGKQ